MLKNIINFNLIYIIIGIIYSYKIILFTCLANRILTILTISIETNENNITIVSDERRVEQILLNLLSNAIKFSKKGTITVKVSTKDNFIITQVIDEGIGISKSNLVKLFMPFIQLEGGLSRSHEGTGLGLAICKNLIEKLGGTIKVESKLGIGSIFTFTLPIEQ